MAARTDSILDWLDGQIEQRGLEARVEEALHELRIAQDLVALRDKRGLSQAALAGRLGVSQPAIAKLESGRFANVQLRTLLRLATALQGHVSLRITDATAPAGTEQVDEFVATHRETFDLTDEATIGGAGLGSLDFDDERPLRGQVIAFRSRVA